MESLVRAKNQRNKKMAEINAKNAHTEIGSLTDDVNELSECKKVLRAELVNEVESLEELGAIIL
jgi:hypothetical protein